LHSAGEWLRLVLSSRRIVLSLERAKRISRETNLPSHRVAAAAGFGSVKTFNRVFRFSEGMPPNHFRQRLKD
jgi:transcriptional regulator GlxA family with amidase domain